MIHSHQKCQVIAYTVVAYWSRFIFE